jgi:hypothetical protein
VLTLPRQEFLVWNLQRTDVREDDAALVHWLSLQGGAGVELEFVTAGAGDCIVGSRVEWATARHFRKAHHGCSSLPMPAEALGMEQMDTLLNLEQGSLRCEWPSQPRVWNSLPLEHPVRRDSAHLDLPAVSMERFESWARPHRDSPEMLRAWAVPGDRVRVCFARRPLASMMQQKKQAPRAIQNVWCISTPAEAAMEKFARLTAQGQATVAEELLAALRTGEATLVDAMTSTITQGHADSESQSGVGFNAFTDAVEMTPSPTGLSLIPASVVEDVAFTGWTSDWQREGSLFNHDSRIQPRDLAWAIELPAAKGISLTTTSLARSTMQVSAVLTPDEPCVLAVCSSDYDPEEPAAYWWIARQTLLDDVKPTATLPTRRYLHAVVERADGRVTDFAGVLLHDEIETVISCGTEIPFLEPRADAEEPEKVLPQRVKSELMSAWMFKRHAIGQALVIDQNEWTYTRDTAPMRVVKDRFHVKAADAADYELAVERPVFQVTTESGPLPTDGETQVKQLTAQSQLRLRVMR